MRRLLLVLVALLIVAADASAVEPTCSVTSAEARAERLLRQEIRVRERHGFRADRAYVARLIVAGPPSRRHGIRVTSEEDRYLDRFNRIGVGAKLARYLRKQTDVMDFWEVLDDWPRGPYVAVFLKGDPARHRAAVKRLASYPRSTRIVRVRYSDRDKERIEDRIQRDDKALARAGFEIVGTDSTWGLDRVLVEVVTRREDAKRYFTRRYGPAVKTRVRTKRTVEGCARSTGYTIAPDGMSLTVSYEDAPKPRRIEVAETGDRVSVGLLAAWSVYPSSGNPGGKAIVRLSAPIGNRPVYDASDGRRLVQSGPAPGQPPCPQRPEESELEGLIRERSQYGMNADSAYVQSLIDAQQRFTPEEQAWRDSVQRVEADRVVHDYLFGGRVYPDWGGTTLVARYPEPPSLIVRFVRRFAFHTRALGRVAKVPIRFERSTVPRDRFDALALYIQDDASATDDFLDDFYVVQAEPDEGEQAVDVYVITQRTQTEADTYFKSRYGGILRVHLIGDRVECRSSYSTRF